MDIDSLAAGFICQSIVSSKYVGVVSKKRSDESESIWRVKSGAQKGSNMVHSSSRDMAIHEGSTSKGRQVDMESIPVETSLIRKLRPCCDVTIVQEIEIAPCRR